MYPVILFLQYASSWDIWKFNTNITNTNANVRFHSRWSIRGLTLKWPRYFYSRWCPRGGSWNPPEKNTFPLEFCNEICTIYVRAIKNHNSAKKNSKCCFVSKWRPNNWFLFRVISNLAKFWKKHFSKRIFQWNLAQRRRIWKDWHYWNKIFKKLFRFKMVAKTIFRYCAIMLIYAN